jgi:hypothetical protein
MLTKDQILQDRYQLQRSLGSNAGRQTWLAKDRQTQTTVVVKLLAFNPQMQWDDLKLFEREATVLQQLNHPKIPHYLNYFSIDKEAGGGLSWFGLVQAYIPGLSLQERLKQGERFTLKQIQAIATQVLEVLVYLHGQEPPVLHRDIKPSNLLLDEAGQVHLVDFGAVQNRAAVEGLTFTIVGTTGYAPLEQFWGRAVPASDLYALGATLIHLVTGIAPADLPQRNLRIQFRDRVSLEAAFINWIEALTEPDLEQRYQTAQQALTDLQGGQSPRYALQVAQSPPSNRIKLWRSPQQFQVEIGGWRQLLFLPQDLIMFGINHLLALGGLVSLGLIMVGLVVGTVKILSSTFSIGAEMLLLLLFGSCFAVVGYQCMKALEKEIAKLRVDLKRSPAPFFALGSHSLHLDKDLFVVTWKMFGFTVRRLQGQTANIRAVTGDRGTITVKSLATAYKLGYRLSAAESRWLVHEITDWLNQ